VTGEFKSKDPVSDLQAPHSQTSLNSSQTGQEDPVQYCFYSGNGKDLVSLVQVRLLLRGFLLFFGRQTSVALLWWWAVEDFATIGILDLKKSNHH
jgi:hypothetical protein